MPWRPGSCFPKPMHAAAAFPFGGSESEREFQRPTPAHAGNADMAGCSGDWTGHCL